MSDTDWVLKIMATVRPYLPKDFVGQVELNCFKGTITNANVRQSFKEDSDSRR
jgi:hypothetical protein